MAVADKQELRLTAPLLGEAALCKDDESDAEFVWFKDSSFHTHRHTHTHRQTTDRARARKETLQRARTTLLVISTCSSIMFD